MAGLGNIYVDEVLWAAKVHPETPANKLSKAAMKRVHDQTIAILQLGIEKGGSTIRTYRNALGEERDHAGLFAGLRKDRATLSTQ